MLFRAILLVFAAIFAATIAQAQGAGLSFGRAFATDSPVEISSDALTVDQATGTATFVGNVLIGQGEMRLSARQVVVEYGQKEDGGTKISRLLATGGVTLVNGPEAAEASRATYSLDAGTVVMTGDVILTQGPSAVSGDTLTVDLAQGTGNMQGNVRTILQTGSDQ